MRLNSTLDTLKTGDGLSEKEKILHTKLTKI